MSKKAEERALEAYPQNEVIVYGPLPGANEPNRIDDNLKYRIGYIEGYNQAEKDIKEAIVKHFKYKQDHSPEHTLHWWVYKNVIDKVNEL